MATVMLCDGRGIGGEADRLAAALRAAGHAVDLHTDPAAAIETVMACRPEVLVFVLRAAVRSDLYILRVARRALPEALLVVIATEASLATRTVIQPLRLTWYAVSPVDPAELCEVIGVVLPRRVAARALGQHL